MHMRLNSFRVRIALIVMLLFLPTFVLVLQTAEEQRALAIEKGRSDALALTNDIAADNEQYIEAARQLLIALAELPQVRNKETEPCNGLLAAMFEHYTNYAGLFVVDTDTGRNICRAPDNSTPVDNSQFPWYQKVLSTGSFVVSDYRLGPISGRPVVTMAMPVTNDEGQITAVVAAGLSLDWLNTTIRRSSPPANTTITLTDSTGVVLARYPGPASMIGHPYANRAMMRAITTHEQGTIRTDDTEHHTRLFGYTRIGTDGGGINVIVGVPENEILADARSIRDRNLLTLSGLTILMVALAAAGSSFVTRPIRQLTRACRDMIAGEMGKRPELDTPIVELQHLLRAFNEMASSVETRLRERMSDLEAANEQLRRENHERIQAETRTQILQEVTAGLSEAVTTEQVARVVVEKGLLATGSIVCLVALHDPAQEALALTYHHAIAPELVERFAVMPLTASLPLVDAYRSREPIWIESDQEYAARYPDLYSLISAPARHSVAMATLPLNVGGHVIGSIYASFDRPRTFDKVFRVLLCTVADYCAQALERARLYEDEIQARQEAENTTNQIARLYSLAAALSDTLTQEQVAQLVVEQGVLTLGATAGTFSRLDEGGQTFTLLQITGGLLPAERLQEWHNFPLDPTFPLTDVVQKKQSFWFSSSEDFITRYPSMSEFKDIYPGGAVFLPLIVEGELIGALSFAFTVPRQFTNEDHVFMMALTQQGAQAFERTRLAEKSRMAAAHEERQRLARDLHDAVSQTLFSSTTIAEALPRQWERNPERTLDLLKQVVILNRAAMAEMRTLLLELRPETIQKTELKVLLRQLLDAATGRKHIKADLIFEGDPELLLPPDVHMTFYRIAQESINNILKHSQAQQIMVELQQTPARVLLTVSDNGCGFDMAQNSAGLGLHSMRERAESIGAAMEIHSQPNNGTSIHVTWLAPA